MSFIETVEPERNLMDHMTENQAFFTSKQLRDRYGLVRVSTLWDWRQRRGFPAPLRLGHKTLCWDVEHVLDWERSMRANTSKHKGGSNAARPTAT
jgi:predicted DNA-binding transcriptional regulator AlpA